MSKANLETAKLSNVFHLVQKQKTTTPEDILEQFCADTCTRVSITAMDQTGQISQQKSIDGKRTMKQDEITHRYLDRLVDEGAFHAALIVTYPDGEQIILQSTNEVGHPYMLETSRN